MKVLRRVYLSMIMSTFLYVCLQVATKPVSATPVPSVNKNILHEDTSQHGDWPDEVDDYVKSFVAAGISQGYTTDLSMIHIRFSNDLPQGTLGQCNLDTRIIQIAVAPFRYETPAKREWTIWHELGHCILNRMHDQYIVTGYPVSIMYSDSSAAENEYWYWNHREEYVKELFSVQD